MEERGGYLWFNGVRVFAEDMRLLCVVAGRVVPLPVAILHPDCRLAADGMSGASACHGAGRSNRGSARKQCGRADYRRARGRGLQATRAAVSNPNGPSPEGQ